MGYFCIDKDSTDTKVVFNKTVGLRDNWAKQKPKAAVSQKQSNPKHERKPIDVIKQLGKKIHNLSEEKQKKVKAEKSNTYLLVFFMENWNLFSLQLLRKRAHELP